MPSRPLSARPLAVLVLALAVLALLLNVRDDRGSYAVRAHFVDAGQLVEGGVVEVAGRQVGGISDIRLTDNGLAEVEMKLDDDQVRPLHRGTVASIRQVGLSGVANRFVDLRPGPANRPEIPDGGVLSPAETRSIVDLDALLNSLDRRTRSRLRRIIRHGASIYEGPPSPRDANRALSYLNPALSEARALSEEALLDQAALVRLLDSSATVSTVLAGRRVDLEGGIAETAAVLRAIARERGSLDDLLARAPAVMRRARATLRHVRLTLPAVRPALREAQPVARPLAATLTRLPPTAGQAVPVVRDLRALLPDLDRVLRALPPLERRATPALRSTVTAVRALLPTVVGLRPYATDLVNGLFIGFGGSSGGYYDANGHFTRVSVQVAPEGLADLLLTSLFPGQDPTDVRNQLRGGYREGLDERCPGAAAEPAPDESNPWRPDAARCDPDHDHDG